MNDGNNVLDLLGLIRQALYTRGTRHEQTHAMADAFDKLGKFLQGPKMSNYDFRDKLKSLIEIYMSTMEASQEQQKSKSRSSWLTQMQMILAIKLKPSLQHAIITLESFCSPKPIRNDMAISLLISRTNTSGTLMGIHQIVPQHTTCS